MYRKGEYLKWYLKNEYNLLGGKIWYYCSLRQVVLFVFGLIFDY